MKLLAMVMLLLLTQLASGEIMDHAGYPQPQPNNVANAITVKDINNDNIPEIIVAPHIRSVRVYDISGNLLWKAIAGRETASNTVSPLVADINGDGNFEVLLGGGTPGDMTYMHSLYIWNSRGTLLKSYDLGNGYAPSTPAFANGIILVGLSGSYTGLYAYDMSGLKWKLPFAGGSERMNGIAVGDIDGDGRSEAVLAGGGKVTVVNAAVSGGSVRWQKDVPDPISPVIINVSGKKVVVASGSSGTFAWDAAGVQLWSSAVASKYYINTYSSPAVSDLNNDGSDDVIIVNDFSVYAISGIDGSMLFQVSTVTWPRGSFRARPAIYDINKDSKPEIITGDSNGNLYIWDSTGKLLDGFPVRITNRVKSMHSSPAVYDLEGDGIPEVVIGSATHLHVVSIKAQNIPPTAVISSPKEGDVFQLNDEIQFVSGSFDPDGRIVSAKWSVNGTLLCEGNSCTAKLPAGKHNIMLEVTDEKGAINTTSIGIRINLPPIAVIDSPADGSIFRQKDAAAFSGTGMDGDGFIASYLWLSDIDGLIGTTSSFTSSDLSTGVHNITFTVTDNDGASDSRTIRIIQKGYSVEWDMKQKPIMGEMSLLSSAGSKSIYKPGSMVPIKFTVSEGGSLVVDTGVRVAVSDAGGREVFSAAYGNGSKAVRINEEGKYIANFKSSRSDPAGIYKIEVSFGSKRKNQDWSTTIYLLDQKTAYFVNRPVNIKANTQGQAFTYKWKLGGIDIGTGQELNWVPEAPGIYNIQLFVTKNDKKTDTENYSIIVNAEADANGDDAVNVLDLSLLGLNWGKAMQDNDFDDSADVNGDGVIDILDAVRIGKKWT